MRRGRDWSSQRRRSASMAHSMSWGPRNGPRCSTAMRASDSTSSSLKHGSDASSCGSGSSRTPPVRGGHDHRSLEGGCPEPDSKLGVALHADGLGRRPAVHQTRSEALDHVDQNDPGIGTRGVGGVHDPAGDRVGHDQESDRHGARCEFVQLSIVDGLGGEEAFDHLPIGIDQPVPLHVEHGKELAGKGVGAVLSDGAGADGHAGRRAEGLREPIVGVQDRLLDRLRDRKRR